MAASIFHIVGVLSLLSDVQAQSSSSSSSSAAVEITMVSNNTNTNTTDICSQDEYTSDCWYTVTCKTCLKRAGCAIEVATARCVSSTNSAVVESSSSSELSDSQYFLSGEANYCSAVDPACFTCRRANAPAVCLGSDNCVCVSQCERISSRPTKCMPGGVVGGLSTGTLAAAAAVILPLVGYMIFRGSPCGLSCSVRRTLERRRREKNRRNLPAGLKLDAWRNHLNERAGPADDTFTNLELRSCFVPMESRRQPRGDGAETDTGAHVEEEGGSDGDVSRAVAATDMPFSPRADRVAMEDKEERTPMQLV